MSNYWKAPTETINAIRLQAIEDLNYPNGRANEPFAEGGDFTVEGVSYVACQCPGPYAGDFEDLESISMEEYMSAQPVTEEEE